MKRIGVFALGVFFATLLLISGCKEDTTSNVTKFRLTFIGKVGSENLILNQSYVDPGGREFQLTMFKFYVSNLILIKEDNSEVMVNDIELIDFDGGATKMEGQVEEGNYKGIKFGLGVAESMNGKDPSEYANSHPLGVYANMYWTWATQYRFAIIEGKADTTGTGTLFDVNFAYHTGTNALYREISYPDNPFVAVKGTDAEMSLTVDALEVFYGDSDFIDFTVDQITHTTGDFALAERITENLAAAIN